LTDEITVILKGRDISQWRSEIDVFKDRERLLTQTGEIIERIDKIYTTLTNQEKDLKTLKDGQMALSEEIKSSSGKRHLLEKNVASLEAQVALLSRIRDFEEERRRLEDGKPCPLCGSPDHPYAQGNVPVLDEAETELKKTKGEYKGVSERLSKLEASLVKIVADIQHAEKEIAEKKADLDADENNASMPC